MWDVFAVTTYLTTSLLFWFMGLVPDIATYPAIATRKRRQPPQGEVIYGLARRSAGAAPPSQWHRYERAYN